MDVGHPDADPENSDALRTDSLGAGDPSSAASTEHNEDSDMASINSTAMPTISFNTLPASAAAGGALKATQEVEISPMGSDLGADGGTGGQGGQQEHKLASDGPVQQGSQPVGVRQCAWRMAVGEHMPATSAGSELSMH